MAPARSNRRTRTNTVPQDTTVQLPDDPNVNSHLFIDPMLGTPLAMYVEKDVDYRHIVVQMIERHGGTVAPGYSGVTYILVDAYKSSGQNLWRQYAGKKGKVVLDSRWVHECVKVNQLQTFQSDWAGCKLTGKEHVIYTSAVISNASAEASAPAPPPTPTSNNNSAPPPSLTPIDPLLHQHQQQTQFYHNTVFAPPLAPPPPPPPPPGPAPQPWQGPPLRYRDETPSWTGYAQQQPHEQQQHPHPNPQPHSHHQSSEEHPSSGYEYRYRDEAPWVPGAAPYYDTAAYEQAYPNGGSQYLSNNHNSTGATNPPAISAGSTTAAAPANAIAGPSRTSSTTDTAQPEPERRGRKRTRLQPTPATEPSALVINRNPRARSPTPPTRVIKSTYGGNLFTSDDVIYLKKYIDYCQDEGLVLSLREICERIAVKAPHHTFYSWRRYCNKHQIRLGGYIMNAERSSSPHEPPSEDREMELDLDMFDDDAPGASASGARGSGSVNPNSTGNGNGANTHVHHTNVMTLGMAMAGTGTHAHSHILSMSVNSNISGNPGELNGPAVGGTPTVGETSARPIRTRSPTPPRALFRSTTGKGVAFTQDDVDFLVKYMDHRKSQGRLDMVKFWKDVATKAPHHSRASWMKFWRRHKHELDRSDGDDPLPQPPDKKMRYSREDDILLAKYFFNKPAGTSDKIFQAFGRMHPHHPWKGWQEHNRIHKAKIDHLMQLLAAGQDIENEEVI